MNLFNIRKKQEVYSLFCIKSKYKFIYIPRAASSADYKVILGDGDEVMDQLFAAAVEARLVEI
jgi:hypothetical protein